MILSDNGTSFVGAHKELQEMTINHNDVEDYSSKYGVKWFSTPLSPHQGGIYESLIKQVKRAIQVSIGGQTLSWNEMTTVFAEVKELLNSRPLYVSPNNPDEPQAVIPNHFLIGRASADIPQGPFKESTNLKKRFEFVQQLVQHFWNRLVSEYFPTLTRRVKWLSQGRQLSVGDIVLIVDHNSKRGDWKLAKVTEVYPGRDGVVRNKQLKTAHGLYRRSVQQCCLLLENTLA